MKIVKSSHRKDYIENDCKTWANEIEKEYVPDLIVFIAKSGYLFAKPMAEIFGCPLASIEASRPKTGSKDKLKGIIKCIPKSLLLNIISSPLMYRMNEKKTERNIVITDSLKKYRNSDVKNILVVDDSVDTGWTILAVKDELTKLFPDANIKIATYTVIEISQKRVEVDYYRVKNEVVLTATSRHSDEYEAFLDDYEKWCLNYIAKYRRDNE